MQKYDVEIESRESSEWHPGGIWRMGSRPSHYLTNVTINSTDDGQSFTGTITYLGERAMNFRATHIDENNYTAESQWRNNTPWQPEGLWVIGARPNQRCLGVRVGSGDNGATLTGNCTYAGEEPLNFHARRQ